MKSNKQKSVAVWKKLEARGAIALHNTRQETMDTLVQDWLESPDSIVLVHNHADSQAISDRLRQAISDRVRSFSKTLPCLTAHPAPFEGLTPDDIEAILAERHV